MSSAGQQLIAGRIPGELIGETIAVADSSTFTGTEATVISLTVSLVAGRTYRLVASGIVGSDTATDDVRVRIREDNTTGTELQTRRTDDVGTANPPANQFYMQGRFTAVATASKTFVLTGIRVSGAGNCLLRAASTRPAFLSCHYHSG